jgi:serine/threonine-protein kinase
MGVVYKAEDTQLRRPVALKFLPPELTRDEEAKKRFIREARAASALDHPNICNIHEISEAEDGQLFICMAYYGGESLKKKVDRGPLPVEEALEIGVRVARGLGKAHDRDIVHRDVKPANIMLTDDGQVKVVDFGLAKLSGSTKVTKTGTTLGTVAYMSPEQTKSEKADARSDIFSLGVVLYELLTGKIPWDGDNEAAVVYGIMCKDPEPLSKFRDDTGKELQRVIDKVLSKDVDKRYQNAADLEVDLKRILDGMKPALPKQPVLVRHGKAIATAGVIAAVAALLLVLPWTRHVITGVVPGGPDEKQIVVLPFENLGGIAENQAFCDGLMETLTSQLTQLEQFHGALWVVPASEVRRRGISSPSEAHRVFGVNLVVGGGVQRFEGRFRVTLNLIDVSDDDRPIQLSSSVIDDFMENVAMLQDETVTRMAGMLDVELAPDAREALAQGGTDVGEAYELYLEGRGHLQRYESGDNIDRAIQLFEQALRRDPNYTLAHAGLGEAYWRKYRKTMDPKWVALAVENGEKAVGLDQNLVPVRVTLGMIYAGTGEYEKAISVFEEVLAFDPANAAAHREMATAYSGAGMLEEAEKTYRRAIELRPQYWGGHYDLGVFYWRHDRKEDAVVEFERVVELTPDNMWGYNSLGAAYYTLDRWDEAHAMFERSIEAQPNYRAYSNLGTLDYIAGRYQAAAEMYEKALELNDTSYLTWANLANAYYWIPGKREDAIDTYRRAAEMAEELRTVNPRNANLLASMAGYYAMIDEGDRAVELINQALELKPDNSTILYFAGFTYEQLGEREKAVEHINRAIGLGYQVAEIEADPWLVDLRNDPRVRDSLAQAKSQETHTE